MFTSGYVPVFMIRQLDEADVYLTPVGNEPIIRLSLTVMEGMTIV